MPQLGPLEILVVLVVALMVFGPKRLPEVGRQVGHGLRELRKIQDTVRAEIHDVLHTPDVPTVANRTNGPDADPHAGAYRTVGTTGAATGALAGRPAPSRFRPALGPASSPPESSPVLGAETHPAASGAPDSSAPAPTADPVPGAGMRAPSRFRAPGA